MHQCLLFIKAAYWLTSMPSMNPHPPHPNLCRDAVGVFIYLVFRFFCRLVRLNKLHIKCHDHRVAICHEPSQHHTDHQKTCWYANTVPPALRLRVKESASASAILSTDAVKECCCYLMSLPVVQT